MWPVRAVARDVCETPSPVSEQLPQRLSVARAHILADCDEKVARRFHEQFCELLHRVELHQLRHCGEVGVLQPLSHHLHVPFVVRVGLILVRRVRALQRAARVSIVKFALKSERRQSVLCESY